MTKTDEAKPKKNRFFAALKESMTKTSEGCGPDCGCHVPENKEAAKDPKAPAKSNKSTGVR